MIFICFFFFSLSVVFIQVCAREHDHPGGVCRGGGGESLLCTRPVARRDDQLAGDSRQQSDQDGRGRLRCVPPDRSLIPLEQQQQRQQQRRWRRRRQRRRRRSKDRRGAAVGRRAAVFQSVEAPERRGGTGHGQSHSNQYAAARGPAERRVHVGRRPDLHPRGKKANTFENHCGDNHCGCISETGRRRRRRTRLHPHRAPLPTSSSLFFCKHFIWERFRSVFRSHVSRRRKSSTQQLLRN